jgi:N-hydroxyarylamine O-acetyltransferase
VPGLVAAGWKAGARSNDHLNLQAYLGRIGYRGGLRPDLSVLVALQQSHVCAVPFENLDVQLGRPVTTAAEDAYEKIVGDNRGGWCYEQNGLFGWALEQIGFDVTRIAAAVMRKDRGDASLANHLCLLVTMPGSSPRYLVDVGFGGSMFEPIELLEGAHTQAPFRLGLERDNDGHWRFWEDIGDGKFSYDFLDEPANESALQDKCITLQSDPSSIFVLNLVAQLRSREQHKVLRGRVLYVASANGIVRRTLNSADELVATLASQFNLDLPEVAELWPRIAARHEEILRMKADIRER